MRGQQHPLRILKQPWWKQFPFHKNPEYCEIEAVESHSSLEGDLQTVLYTTCRKSLYKCEMHTSMFAFVRNNVTQQSTAWVRTYVCITRWAGVWLCCVSFVRANLIYEHHWIIWEDWARKKERWSGGCGNGVRMFENKLCWYHIQDDTTHIPRDVSFLARSYEFFTIFKQNTTKCWIDPTDPTGRAEPTRADPTQHDPTNSTDRPIQ